MKLYGMALFIMESKTAKLQKNQKNQKKKKKCDTIFGKKHLTLPSKLLRNCLDTLIHTQMYAYKH